MQQVLIGIALAVGLVLLGGVVSFIVVLASEARRPRILCLMYHRFSSREEYERRQGVERIFTLPVDAFEEQIAYLKRAGYAFLTPEQVERFATGRLDLTGPAVLITCDDGCLSVRERALAVLQRHGARATAFVTLDADSYVFREVTEADRRMTDDELRAVDGEVLRCESHAVTHRPLSGLPDDELRDELVESKRQLERILSRDVGYLAVPSGWVDDRVRSFASKAGYKAVWCSDTGAVHVGADPLYLRRINIEGSYSLDQFKAAIRPFGIAQRRWVLLIKRIPARLLGPRIWLPLRQAVLRCIPGHRLSVRATAVILAVLAAIGVLCVIAVLLSLATQAG